MVRRDSSGSEFMQSSALSRRSLTDLNGRQPDIADTNTDNIAMYIRCLFRILKALFSLLKQKSIIPHKMKLFTKTLYFRGILRRIFRLQALPAAQDDTEENPAASFESFAGFSSFGGFIAARSAFFAARASSFSFFLTKLSLKRSNLAASLMSCL